MTLMISLIGLASVTSCESDSAAYKRGYSAGYQEGSAGLESQRAESHQAGFKAGYEAGFEAARPSARTTQPAGFLKTVSIVVMVFGMVKIVFSLVFFIGILILDSTIWTERFAKILATTLAALVVFWVSHISSVGLSDRLSEVALGPAATTLVAKVGVGLLAAALAWLSLWLLERVVQESKGRAELQTLLVFVASVVVAVLIPFFVSLFSAPNITSYRFFDVIVGVVLGGIFWILQRLLAESKNSPSTQQRRAYYYRVFYGDDEQSSFKSNSRLPKSPKSKSQETRRVQDTILGRASARDTSTDQPLPISEKPKTSAPLEETQSEDHLEL